MLLRHHNLQGLACLSSLLTIWCTSHMPALGGCCCARLVLSLRQEYLPGGVRMSQEEAKAAAVKAREVRLVRLSLSLRPGSASHVCTCWLQL